MDTVITYFNHTWGYVELIGTIASAICVYLAIQQNIWTWFWGALGVAFFGPLFYHYGLYSDAALQILFFLPVQAIGYYWWMKKGPGANNDLPVARLKPTTIVAGLVAMLILSAATAAYTSTLEGVSFPYIDGLTTWMSIFAQVLMIKKIFESWVLWVSMDAIAIFVYFAKGMVVVSGLYVLFFVLATMGGIAWYKSWKEQENVRV